MGLFSGSAFALASANDIEGQLRVGVQNLFREPERLLTVIPFVLPPDEERKTLYAMHILFRNCRIEKIELAGVTAAGHVGKLAVRVRNIDVFGLRVDDLTLEAQEFDVDLPKLALGSVVVISDAKARMASRVLEADLNKVSPAYQLELKHDDFAVAGRTGVLFIRAGYRLHGTLVTNPENQIIFRPKSLSYGFLPIPKALYASQVRRINPLFDMARFLGLCRGNFDMKFDKVALEDKECAIELSGMIHAKPIKVEPIPPPPPRL